ncbi:MAG: (d)CMP kinase [Candidatus Dormibacteria bacterium]
MTPPVITIDGPAGSGKTTLGRHLATTLGLPLVDTGLFYRGVMVAAARAGIGPDDRAALIECARQTVVTIDTDPTHDDAGRAAMVNGIEAGPPLRDPANAPLLASVSSIPEVRIALLDAQRRLATRGAVAVGRDCGTVVFPDAQLKLYLDATEEIRAQRRASQLQRAADPDSALMRGEVGERDRLDASRSDGPMQPAPGAYRLDTGVLGIDDVVRTALDLWAGVATAPG